MKELEGLAMNIVLIKVEENEDRKIINKGINYGKDKKTN